MLRIFSKLSLHLKLLIPTVFLLLIIMATIGFIQHSVSSSRQEKAIVEEAQSKLELLAQLSTTYLMNFDVYSLETFAKQAQGNAEVDYVSYSDVSGKFLTGSEKQTTDADAILPLVADIKGSDGAVIGRVEMGYKKDKLTVMRKSNAIFTAAGTLLIVTVFSLILFFVTRKIAKSMGELTERLNSISRAVQENAEEILDGSKEMSDGAGLQVLAVKNTADILGQFETLIQVTTENTKKSLDISRKNELSVNKGSEAINNLNQTFSKITEVIEQMNNEFKNNLKNINEIVSIINTISNQTAVINTIAYQTKLLSFNASVEAARAGEHGAGFSIVAEEVRKLAALSSESATTINGLLTESIDKGNLMSKKTDANLQTTSQVSRQSLEDGYQVVSKVNEALQDIFGTVSDGVRISTETAQAGLEQSAGVKKINGSVLELMKIIEKSKGVTITQNELAEDLLSTSKNLDSVSVGLSSLLFFK